MVFYSATNNSLPVTIQKEEQKGIHEKKAGLPRSHLNETSFTFLFRTHGHTSKRQKQPTPPSSVLPLSSSSPSLLFFRCCESWPWLDRFNQGTGLVIDSLRAVGKREQRQETRDKRIEKQFEISQL